MMGSLSLSFIIRATLMDESKTIGQMKAIGLRNESIGKLYQMKYMVLVVCSVILGYLLSIPLEKIFSRSVILYCGYGEMNYLKWIFPLFGLMLLAFYVILKSRRIIRKNLKNTVVELIRGKDRIKDEGHFKLPKRQLKFKNLSMAFGELKCKWKQYVVIFLVFVLASFLILLPSHMKYTTEDASFMTYMGVGKCDIRIDLQYQDQLIEEKNAILSYLEADPEISKFAVYQYGYLSVLNDDESLSYIRVENGDFNVFPLQYLKGSSPKDAYEIALSYLNAVELNKNVGDYVSVFYKDVELTLYVSGIYQDITYGGKTAKANIEFDPSDVEVYIIYIDLIKNVDIDQKVTELRTITELGKITPIKAFVNQTLGGIQSNLHLVKNASAFISIVLIIIITSMVLRLLAAKEHTSIAIKKAIGFTNFDIRMQYGIRIFIVQAIGIIVGTILANTLGELIFSLMLKNMGAAKIKILVEPITSYMVYPILQIASLILTIIFATQMIKKYHIRDQIIE
jgi:putative ABC transport system permease protein